jgi:hypothetical protein
MMVDVQARRVFILELSDHETDHLLGHLEDDLEDMSESYTETDRGKFVVEFVSRMNQAVRQGKVQVTLDG